MGHCTLKGHHKLGILDDTFCRFCEAEEENTTPADELSGGTQVAPRWPLVQGKEYTVLNQNEKPAED